MALATRFVVALLATCIMFMNWTDTVAAQGLPAAPGANKVNFEQDALFQRILKEPANLDLAFRHAEMASANGDYEAAIGSLERLLFFNPNLPRVQLELGVLYFRLGSYEMSREYLKKAITPAETPPEVLTRVTAYLVEIEKRLNPSQTTAFAQTGLRYQTNANAGPNGEFVRVFGLDATLNRQFVKAHDWNLFGQGLVRNVMDLGNQRGDTWETSIGAYLTHQRAIARLDTALLDLQTGPRLALFPDHLNGWSVRPYGGVTLINLGSNDYLSARTVGTSIAWMPTPGWYVEAGAEHAWRDFNNSPDYPTVANQSGSLKTGYLNLSGLLFGGWTWSARGALSDNDAEAAFQSYRQRGVDVSLSYAMNVPLFGVERRLTVVPFAGYLETRYNAPDVFVDPNMEREDRERRVGVAFDAQMSERFGFGVRLQYSATKSNISNFETNNLSVFAGPTFRF